MIDKPAPGQEKTSRLIIMDNGPISALSNIDGALDWLFAPGCEVWMTDMVLIEARRPASPEGKRRKGSKANFETWFGRNRFRIKVVETNVGRAYERGMQLWEMAGRPPEMEPATSDLGEASILSKLKAVRRLFAENEAAVVLMDDRDGRAAVKALPMDIDLMGTQTFLTWIAEDFGVKAAETAWITLRKILLDELEPGEADDPIYVRGR